MIFNTITYLVLGILLREPRSGYDIVKELASFRPAKSSQIYPILAKLEKNGFLDCTQVQQDGKPNKKIYSVTSKGKDKLQSWLDTQPEPPVVRDDCLSMIFSVWIKEPETLERLVKGRKRYMEERLTYFTAERAAMETKYPADSHNFYSWRHSNRLLYNRRIAITKEEIRWCDEILSEFIQTHEHTEASV